MKSFRRTCAKLDKDGNKCQWIGFMGSYPAHLEIAHGVKLTPREPIMLGLNNYSQPKSLMSLSQFFVAKNPPSFEECFRLNDNDKFKHLLFDSMNERAESSTNLKYHYRDILRDMQSHASYAPKHIRKNRYDKKLL